MVVVVAEDSLGDDGFLLVVVGRGQLVAGEVVDACIRVVWLVRGGGVGGSSLGWRGGREEEEQQEE